MKHTPNQLFLTGFGEITLKQLQELVMKYENKLKISRDHEDHQGTIHMLWVRGMGIPPSVCSNKEFMIADGNRDFPRL